MSTHETSESAGVLSPKAVFVASAAVFGLSLAAMLLLGRYLHIVPGSPYQSHINVLFDADTADGFKRLTLTSYPNLFVVHPLIGYLWGSLGAVLSNILRVCATLTKFSSDGETLMMVLRGDLDLMTLVRKSTSWDVSHFSAAIGLVSIVVAMGFGCLTLISLRLNRRYWNILLLFPVCLLFTANAIIAQPEHFGLSFGLLATASLAALPGLQARTRGGLLGVTGLLNAGTTITNGLFPVLVAVVVFRDRINLANTKLIRYGILTAGVVSALLAAAAVVQWRDNSPQFGGYLKDATEKKAPNIKWRASGSYIGYFTNLRLIRDPLAAARFAGSGLLYPAVGPRPSVWRILDDPTQQSHQSYEESRLSDYGFLSGVAACAWVALLAASSIVLIRSPDLRNYCYALFGWIAFNLVFHNLWGDEFFLYSAHWSWALMLIVLLGSRALPTWVVAVAVALIIPGQLSTLSTIRELVFA